MACGNCGKLFLEDHHALQRMFTLWKTCGKTCGQIVENFAPVEN